MKKREVLFYIIWLIVLVILQPTVIARIKIFGNAPDMFLVFIVFTGLIKGRWHGTIWGFIFGFVFDLTVGKMIGISAGLYMLIGFLAGGLRERVLNFGPIFTSLVILASAFICGIFYYFGHLMVYGDLGFFTALLRTILPKALYTAIAGLILFKPIKASFNLIKERRVI